MNKILIREYQATDLNVITSIMMEAFESKFRYAFYWKEKELFDILYFHMDKTEYTKILVALLNDEISGFCILKSQIFKKNKMKGIFHESVKRFGLLNTLKFYIPLFILDSGNTKEGELYIDTIAVTSRMRGKGIGKAMFNEINNIADNNTSIKELTLYVMLENEKAHKLYSSLNFINTKIHKSLLIKHFSGYSGAIYMKKDVNS